MLSVLSKQSGRSLDVSSRSSIETQTRHSWKYPSNRSRAEAADRQCGYRAGIEPRRVVPFARVPALLCIMNLFISMVVVCRAESSRASARSPADLGHGAGGADLIERS